MQQFELTFGLVLGRNLKKVSSCRRTTFINLTTIDHRDASDHPEAMLMDRGGILINDVCELFLVHGFL